MHNIPVIERKTATQNLAPFLQILLTGPPVLSATNPPITSAPITSAPTSAPVANAPTNGAPITNAPAPATGPNAPTNIFDRGSDDEPSSVPADPISIVTVPIDFTANLELPSNSSANGVTELNLDRVESLWEASLLDYLRDTYGERPGVLQVLGVDLALEPTTTRRVRRRRRLQEGATTSTTTTVQATGGADFEIDTALIDDTQAFVTEVGGDLDQQLTESDLLQQSLADSTGDDAVIVSGVVAGATDRDAAEQESSDGPSTVEIVIGFTLLVLTLATLAFWGRVLWRKRQKRKKRRRLEEMRRSQSIYHPETVMRQSRMGGDNNNTDGDKVVQIQPTRSLESMSTYKGIASGSDEDEENNVQQTSSDESASNVSDPFWAELQRAASLDRAAWEEFQRKKESLQLRKQQQQQANGDANNSIGRVSSLDSSVGVAASRNVAVYDAPGSQDMGMEVEPATRGSFPYGDENASSTAPVPLTSNDAVEWTTEGILLAAAYRGTKKDGPENDDDSFEPYGDRKSLQQSWDLDEYPVKDESGPSRFSFLFPLKRTSAEVPDVPDALGTSASEDSPTDAAIRESADVTSVDSETDFGGADDGSLTEVTKTMLKEVDEIAEYVKQYEQRKVDSKSRQRMLERAQRKEEQSRLVEQAAPNDTSYDPEEAAQHQNPQEHSRSPDSKALPNPVHNSQANVAPAPMSRQSGTRITQQHLTQSMESTGTQSVEYNHLDDSDSARRQMNSKRIAAATTTPRQVITMSATLSDSSSSEVEEEVDDSSLRLGISRISVEKPTAPSLSFRNDISGDSAPFDTTQHISPIKQPSDEDSFLHQQQKPSDTSAMESVGSKTSVLSSLRQSPSILDTAPSDERTHQTKSTDESKGEKRGLFRRMSSRGKQVEEASPPIEHVATKRKKKASPRSNNPAFNSVFSMFESRPTTPIVPPNETWQYSGSNSGAGSKREAVPHRNIDPPPLT